MKRRRTLAQIIREEEDVVRESMSRAAEAIIRGDMDDAKALMEQARAAARRYHRAREGRGPGSAAMHRARSRATREAAKAPS